MQKETDNAESQAPVKRNFKRFWIVLLLINLAFLAVIFRLFFIQGIDSERYKIRAKNQHEMKIPLSPERGYIYDRNGKLLVSNIKGVSIAVDPTFIEDKAKLCDDLGKILDIPPKNIEIRIDSDSGTFVWIRRGYFPDINEKLESIVDSGFIKINEAKRNYLYGSVASQVIGCTNVDNIGLTGIELKYDSLLKGRPGYIIMQRDGKKRLKQTADLPEIPAQHGHSLELTIDIELQQIVEFELQQGVMKTRSESGTVVAIDPRDGSILAMASYPTFNPNTPGGFDPKFMRNRAITDVYEPGSTFKLMTAAIALEEKIVAPDDTVNGRNGFVEFEDYSITDDHPVGRITFREAFEQSSNIVFSELAFKTPSDKLYKYNRDFGFGNKLGIDLVGEVTGQMRYPKKFTAYYKRYLGHGYGMNVSALQIASAYATVANGGTLMKPYVIRTIKDHNDNILKKISPEKIRRVISKRTCDTLTQLLIGIVERGTGKLVRIKGVSIAGKTGTSQQLTRGEYSKRDYNASFAGFFPAEDPKIVMLVILDKPRGGYYGGSTAGPIFRNIASRWVNISPDFVKENEEQEATNDTLAVVKIDSIYVPQIKGMSAKAARELFEEINLTFISNKPEGVVISQQPRPGKRVPKSCEVFAEVADTSDFNEHRDSLRHFQRPDVRGLTLRRALSILHKAEVRTIIKGSGKVRRQSWKKEKGKYVCTLFCK